MNILSDVDAAWVSGILEGEGCFSIHTRKSGRQAGNTEIGIHCEMTDEDVVVELQRLTNVGVLYREPAGHKRKATTRWSVNKQADVFNLCIQLLPYMKSRRKSKIRDILNFLEEKVVGSV